METLRLTAGNIGECVKRAAEVLHARGVVVYPTDTLYGLGADAFSDEAVDKIYAVKARDESKPVHCIVADIEMAGEYGEFNDAARSLAEKFLPGPLTIVVPKKPDISSGIVRGIQTIGFRMPNDAFCLALARLFSKPYTTTSANVSGERPERSMGEILKQLGNSAADIGLAIDAGELPERRPSTVVGVSGGDVIVLREGAISAEEIMQALGA